MYTREKLDVEGKIFYRNLGYCSDIVYGDLLFIKILNDAILNSKLVHQFGLGPSVQSRPS